jgi:predicted DNA-binding protein with PD1-like motif
LIPKGLAKAQPRRYTATVIVAESRLSRRLVGRLDRGADLLEQLNEVCRVHEVRAGEVRASGAVEEAILVEWDQRGRSARAPRHFAASLELVSLTGHVAERDGRPTVQAHASLSRERDNGIELLGGRLLAARVFACEFVIDAFDDLRLVRQDDAATGLALLSVTAQAAPVSIVVDEPSATEKLPRPAFEAPARTDWKDVVAASERRVEAAKVTEVAVEVAQTEVQAKTGDLIEHPKFGRCVVERIDGDYEFVTARLRNQRLIRLSLDVLTLIPIGQESGHNLFRAVLNR